MSASSSLLSLNVALKIGLKPVAAPVLRQIPKRVKTDQPHSAWRFYEVKLASLDQLIDRARANASYDRRFVRSRHLRLLAALFAPGEPISTASFYCENSVRLDGDLSSTSGLHSAFESCCNILLLWLT
jgi:hypothetical protein